MLIGMTYDLKDDYLKEGYAPELVAECDSIVTIDAIDAALQKLGHQTVRIGNVKALVGFLAAGKTCDLVFNIAEGMHGLLRESVIPALLDAYRIPYVFSDSFVLAICLHKGFAKEVVRKAGVPTADYCVLSHPQDYKKVDLPYPLFLKPVGGGTGIGITASNKVTDSQQLKNVSESLLATYGQPVLVETFLSGREFTVGITGTGDEAVSTGVMEIIIDHHSDGGIYSYKTKQEYVTTTRYEKPEPAAWKACEAVALAAWRALGCRDGGRIDVKMGEKDVVHFLEVNPLAGLHPIDSDLPILSRMHGLSYDDLIGRIVYSAQKRLGL
ncbi:MAG: ATP-grasp domain-containing protein [Sphaerochaeta sp.]|uniref:D-alanine--D-alanine ligase family protein n=1 Tax=unclassified Sphaerochaeta TaxID=2637943 RepID=UPI0025D9A1AC|nr:ATP-grasp domain-containing protein [Sphaerochaeta sp. UBA5836]